MKRKIKSFQLIGLPVLVCMIVGYLLLAWYYREGFSLNTWINGVYCTGKTVDEVNSELLAGQEAPILTITDRNGNQYVIDMKEAGYTADYCRELRLYMEKQNSLLWIGNILSGRSHKLEPTISYDEEQLRLLFNQLNFVQEDANKEKDYYLTRTLEKGYVLYDGLSDRLDAEKAFAKLKEGVAAGQYTLGLQEAECYFDCSLSGEQEKIKELWGKVSRFQKCTLAYDMGDVVIPLDAAVMSRFLQTENGEIILDTDGKLMVDEAGVKAFVDSLGDSYDTYGKERNFVSTVGETVTISSGTYGTLIDRKAEVEFLMDNLLTAELHEGEEQVRIPVYERQGFVRGMNDIGNTYIEIDMTAQMMYYYEDGELLVETEVVTGNTGRRMGTPEGINYVYKKQRNRILRGEGYASPVKYWMPVNGGIGIHDASWRSKFGGTIYQKNGSHGCINTPTDKMATLYELVEVGTPVIMFYID